MPSRVRAWIPRWWAGEGGAAGRVLDVLLGPAEQAYRVGVGVRNLAYDRGWATAAAAPIPVISVGNIGVGGAGKTPFSAWLARKLGAAGRRPAVVMRGYGADEVLVHRELNPEVPVFAAARRLDATRAAAEGGCDVVVLDDGFQHRALARALDIVLVPAEAWQPRRRLLPRGPWRERAVTLRRAHLIIVTRKTASVAEAERVAGEIARVAPARPVAICSIEPTALTRLHDPSEEEALASLRGRPLLAVASLADPRPFAEHLRRAGAEVELLASPDHHPFDAADADVLMAHAAGRTIVMTQKEAVKLRPLLSPDVPALVLHQRVRMERGAEALEAVLHRTLENGRCP